eukprot:Hpha_TRINITY_DN33585_c0_g1::TRINITY_DN33585_c0_g1_i1::g.171225::m.171225
MDEIDSAVIGDVFALRLSPRYGLFNELCQSLDQQQSMRQRLTCVRLDGFERSLMELERVMQGFYPAHEQQMRGNMCEPLILTPLSGCKRESCSCGTDGPGPTSVKPPEGASSWFQGRMAGVGKTHPSQVPSGGSAMGMRQPGDRPAESTLRASAAPFIPPVQSVSAGVSPTHSRHSPEPRPVIDGLPAGIEYPSESSVEAEAVWPDPPESQSGDSLGLPMSVGSGGIGVSPTMPQGVSPIMPQGVSPTLPQGIGMTGQTPSPTLPQASTMHVPTGSELRAVARPFVPPHNAVPTQGHSPSSGAATEHSRGEESGG